MILRFTNCDMGAVQGQVTQCNYKLEVYGVPIRFSAKVIGDCDIERQCYRYHGKEVELSVSYPENAKWEFIAKYIRYDDYSIGFFGDHIKCLCVDTERLEDATDHLRAVGMRCSVCGREETNRWYLIRRKIKERYELCCPGCVRPTSGCTLYANALDVISETFQSLIKLTNFEEKQTSRHMADAFRALYRPMKFIRSAMYVYDKFGDEIKSVAVSMKRAKKMVENGVPPFFSLVLAFYASPEADAYDLEAENFRKALADEELPFAGVSDFRRTLLYNTLRANNFVDEAIMMDEMFAAISAYRKMKPTKPIRVMAKQSGRKKFEIGNTIRGIMPMDIEQLRPIYAMGWKGYRFFEDMSGFKYVAKPSDSFMPSERSKKMKSLRFVGIYKGSVEINGEKYFLLSKFMLFTLVYNKFASVNEDGVGGRKHRGHGYAEKRQRKLKKILESLIFIRDSREAGEPLAYEVWD